MLTTLKMVRRFGVCAGWIYLVFMTVRANAATVTWSGTGGTSWATGSSWSVPAGPGAGDTASFSDTGASTLPGEVTSVVNSDRSINGLSFNDTASKFHTLDLGTHTL